MTIAPRSIKIIQTSLETGRSRPAELCWARLVTTARFVDNKTPSEILDAMLWGGEVYTKRHAYRIET